MTTETLTGRTAVVTGGARARGIGAAIARSLAQHGATVALTDIPRPQEELAKTCAAINADLPATRVHPVTADVTDSASCDEAIAVANELGGGLDILVNNAGAPQGDDRKDLTEVTDEAWQFVLDVNLTGAFRMTRAALPLLRASGRGRVVSIASAAAIHSLSDRVAYAASKAGIIGMTTSLSGDVGPDLVTVNAVCPGSVDTGRDVVRPKDVSAGPVYSWTPLGRVGLAEDIANTVRFLVSDEAAFITGQAIVVDGGLSTTIRR